MFFIFVVSFRLSFFGVCCHDIFSILDVWFVYLCVSNFPLLFVSCLRLGRSFALNCKQHILMHEQYISIFRTDFVYI